MTRYRDEARRMARLGEWAGQGSLRLREGLHARLGDAADPAWSAAVWAASFGWMAGMTGAVVAANTLLPRPAVNHAVAAPMMSVTLRLAGARIRVWTDPEAEPDRPAVYCQNHVSILDAAVASSVLPMPFCGLMNAWQFRIPFYGYIMRLTDGIAVPAAREGRTSILADQARERVSRGLSILTFPEGHRTRDGAVGPFHRGVFFMAREAGLPVVPVAVRGLYAVNQRGNWRFAPGEIDVWIGRHYETTGLDDAGIGELAKALQQEVASFVASPDVPERAILQREWVNA